MSHKQLSNDVRERLQKAWKYADDGSIDEALRSMGEIVQMRPDRAELRTTMAHFLRMSERNDEAESVLRDAIRVDQHCESAWTELGLVFRDQSRFEEAAFCLAESAKLRPDHATFTLLADVELAFDPKAALTHSQDALKLEPAWEEALAIREAASTLLGSVE